MYYVFVFAIHKSLFSIHTMSKKSDFICPDKFTKCIFFGISGTFGVAVARHGLILWENDATRSTNLFK